VKKVNAACNDVKSKNREKYLWFLLATQVPTHGQWWSCASIQTLHMLQWNDLGGLSMLHVVHNAN
jgi:hypothetical protein